MRLSFFFLFLISCSCSLSQTITPSQASFLSVYDGEGEISYHQNKSLILSPKAPLLPTDTHAGLILLKKTLLRPTSTFFLKFKGKVIKQLRKDHQNSWEALWVFFNYQEIGGYKETNYFIHKTNGVELGLAYGDIGQIFFATSTNNPLKVGETYLYEIIKTEEHILICIDGTCVINYPLLSWHSPLSPIAPLSKEGAIGFYTEDAVIEISDCVLML